MTYAYPALPFSKISDIQRICSFFRNHKTINIMENIKPINEKTLGAGSEYLLNDKENQIMIPTIPKKSISPKSITKFSDIKNPFLFHLSD
ncbi:hypothetical protein HMPREF9370_0508 [Neisseria wadsworthii 9715]|uniref:Uncharacterized protein n=1 Tax=Neisseria wadsworthii 9715 TaxID=1030841 RepID=G4CN49_9NEIS|nr:hypothetical protein HMPREF9370_0508 [Neisseria wadsworthii 9715]